MVANSIIDSWISDFASFDRIIYALHASSVARGSERKMTESKIKSAKKPLASGAPPRDVASNLDVSLATLYRWIPASS